MNHFLPYLQMPITTPEQEQAFHKIVDFWDHTTLRIPLLLRFSGWLNWRLSSKASLQKTLEQTEQRTRKYLNLTEEEYQDLNEYQREGDKQNREEQAYELMTHYQAFFPENL